MAYNADDFLKALETPAFTLDGQTYTGRILSIEEWMPFADRFKDVVEGNTSNAEFLVFAKDFLRAVYPYKLSYRWRPDPVKVLMASPALIPTLTDFFRCQANAIAGTIPPKTNGTGLQTNS